jgi:inosine-uridine nucleoside N-ribohydrolase
MGGSIFPGHPDFPAWTVADDYNVQADPAAAREVLEAATTTLVPIQMSVQTALRRAHLPTLDGCGPLGRLIAHQARAFAAEWRNDERYGRSCAGVPADIINFLHDPLACVVALGWDGVQLREVRLALELDGGYVRLRPDAAGRPHRVVTAVDGPRFPKACWLAHLQRLGVPDPP